MEIKDVEVKVIYDMGHSVDHVHNEYKILLFSRCTDSTGEVGYYKSNDYEDAIEDEDLEKCPITGEKRYICIFVERQEFEKYEEMLPIDFFKLYEQIGDLQSEIQNSL